MTWKTKWGCECGAIWTSDDENPPEHRSCGPVCPKPELTLLPDRPILAEEWDRRLGPEKRRATG